MRTSVIALGAWPAAQKQQDKQKIVRLGEHCSLEECADLLCVSTGSGVAAWQLQDCHQTVTHLKCAVDELADALHGQMQLHE
jgi:hypothetical protein